MPTVPVLRFAPALPVNLAGVIYAQVQCLIDYGLPQQLHVVEDKFKDAAMTLAADFTYSVELAGIGLDRVWLVPYGVSDRYLAEAGGVNLRVDPDKFSLFEGVVVPDGLCVVQGQLGQKHKNRGPCDVQTNYDTRERLGVPTEGLTALLYWGGDMLQQYFMYFPGANSERGFIPFLSLLDGKPVLDDLCSYNYPGCAFGSVSCGS